MTLKEWYIKTFQKDKAVILYVKDGTGRLKKYWALQQEENVVQIPNREAFVVTKETRYLSTKHNIPTWVVNPDNCESIDLTNTRTALYSASQLGLILDNDEAKKLYEATNNKMSSDTVILLAAILIGFIGMFYFFNTKLTDLDNKIPDPTPIVETETNEAVE